MGRQKKAILAEDSFLNKFSKQVIDVKPMKEKRQPVIFLNIKVANE